MRCQARGSILPGMPTTKFDQYTCVLVLLLGSAFTVTMIGCGKTGISLPGSGGSGITASGGSSGQGGVVSSGGTIGQGGVVSSGGTIGQGGVVSSGGTVGQGGVVSSGGTVGQGGVMNSGGTQGSGGSTGGQTGTSIKPRVPTTHRPQAASCVGVHAPEEPLNPSYGDCKKHADCTNGSNGRCIHGVGSAGSFYYCIYDQCATDSDCDAGKVCYCTASDAARCLSVGNCRTDADCGGGSYSYCSPANGRDCGGYHTIDSYYCHTPKDTCIDNSDCTGNNYCNYDAVDGRWECTSPNMTCVIG
jgi:hypothetical protein